MFSKLAQLLSNLRSKRYYELLKSSSQTGLLMGCGDILSQTIMEKKKIREVELGRTLRFGCLGFFLVGPTFYRWYGILEHRLKYSKAVSTAMAKMVVDQVLFTPPFIYGFIWLDGFMQGFTFEETKKNVHNNYLDVMLASFELWPAVQLFNFWVIPLNHRVLFVQSFALFWNTYLAFKLNRGVEEIGGDVQAEREVKSKFKSICTGQSRCFVNWPWPK